MYITRLWGIGLLLLFIVYHKLEKRPSNADAHKKFPGEGRTKKGVAGRRNIRYNREQEAALAQVKKKNEKFTVQMDKNMFMAVYVLPSIKEIGGKKADELADAICKEWGKSFKDSNIIAYHEVGHALV